MTRVNNLYDPNIKDVLFGLTCCCCEKQGVRGRGEKLNSVGITKPLNPSNNTVLAPPKTPSFFYDVEVILK